MVLPIKKNTIFVSLASYRDNLCSRTLDSLYSTAKYPENVFVGICQQNDPSDPDCIIEKYKDHPNVRIMRIPHTEAKGPTFARAICSTLYRDEEYFFQIDSHLLFVKNWDVLAINMIQRIKNEGLSQKPILSHYTRDIADYERYNQEDDNDRFNIPIMCKSFFNERGMISFLGAESQNSKNKFYKTGYIEGGFLFCESKFLQEVPYDFKLEKIFVGEEILLSIRAYTSGYDIFTPSENLVFHYYTRTNAHRPDLSNDSDAFEKIKNLLKLSDGNDISGILGLGTDRTLEEYYEFTKIDVKNKKVYSNFCRENGLATPEEIEGSDKTIKVLESPTIRKSIILINKWKILLFILILALIIYICYLRN